MAEATSNYKNNYNSGINRINNNDFHALLSSKIKFNGAKKQDMKQSCHHECANRQRMGEYSDDNMFAWRVDTA